MLARIIIALLNLSGCYIDIASAQARPVTDLFQVSFTTDDQGGCQTIGQTAMQALLDEALEIARQGVTLMNSRTGAEEVRLLNAFLPGASDAQFSTMQGGFTDLCRQRH
jgi:hypothetical protein